MKLLVKLGPRDLNRQDEPKIEHESEEDHEPVRRGHPNQESENGE